MRHLTKLPITLCVRTNARGTYPPQLDGKPEEPRRAVSQLGSLSLSPRNNPRDDVHHQTRDSATICHVHKIHKLVDFDGVHHIIAEKNC